jgi:hypothetical protein
MPAFDLWRGGNGALNMIQVILFGSGRTGRDQTDLTGGDLKIDDEGQCPVPNILIFPAFHFTRS